MLAVEVTFANAVATAEGVRQAAKAAAYATFAAASFAGGATLTTYIAALLAADVAYTTAVNSAMNTSGLLLGNLSHLPYGPIPNRIANLSS